MEDITLCNYLIVVDMQNDFVTGSLRSKAAAAALPRICNKIEEYYKRNKRVFFTKDIHPLDKEFTIERERVPKHCLKDTEGSYLCKDISYFVNSSKGTVVEKGTFGYLDWAEIIHNYSPKDIEICGVCTDICVISNALILRSLFPGTRIVCDASCCAGTTEEKHKAALDVMESCLVDVVNR